MADELTPEVTTSESDNHGTSPAASFVTRDQLTATVTYLANLIRDSKTEAAELPTPPAQPSAAGTVPSTPADNAEITALRKRLEQFEANASKVEVRASLAKAVEKAGLSPDATEYVTLKLGTKAKLGESGLYLSDGQLIEDYLDEFKATSVGAKFLKTQPAPTPAGKLGGKSSGSGTVKADVEQMLMAAFGK